MLGDNKKPIVTTADSGGLQWISKALHGNGDNGSQQKNQNLTAAMTTSQSCTGRVYAVLSQWIPRSWCTAHVLIFLYKIHSVLFFRFVLLRSSNSNNYQQLHQHVFDNAAHVHFDLDQTSRRTRSCASLHPQLNHSPSFTAQWRPQPVRLRKRQFSSNAATVAESSNHSG